MRARTVIFVAGAAVAAYYLYTRLLRPTIPPTVPPTTPPVPPPVPPVTPPIEPPPEPPVVPPGPVPDPEIDAIAIGKGYPAFIPSVNQGIRAEIGNLDFSGGRLRVQYANYNNVIVSGTTDYNWWLFTWVAPDGMIEHIDTFKRYSIDTDLSDGAELAYNPPLAKQIGRWTVHAFVSSYELPRAPDGSDPTSIPNQIPLQHVGQLSRTVYASEV